LAKKENSPFTKSTPRSTAACSSNPERIQSQNRGAAIMGLSLAIYGEITFKDGKVQQGNFDDFPVNRIDETPLVTNVHIVPGDPDTSSGGVGEPGVPPFAQP
jgi:isoquinoline 1-oxidoreductase beta subunit